MNERIALTRDLRALAGREHDVLVIGGGIHGLAIAYDAAQRGLATALVDRGDFGAAASFNHQKTAHGGLRSLQTGDLRRARESVVERRTLAQIAPRLLRPLPFLLGTYRSATRGRAALRVAFTIDRLVARDRNAGVVPELQLPAARLVSRRVAARLFPGIPREHLTGGAMWYDYQMTEADRLTLGVALAAAAHGAVLANHVDALTPLRRDGRIGGMLASDRLTGTPIEIRARLTINAAGSRAGQIMAALGVSHPLPLVKAMNLVTTRPAGEVALAGRTLGGRMLTLTPWRGAALVGTSQSPGLATPEQEEPEDDEVAAFIAEINEAFPALSLASDAVTLVHRGIVPAELDRRGRPTLKRHAEILPHDRTGAPGAMTVIGVKYTTARAVAERAVDAAERALRVTHRSCRTARDVLPGAGHADYEALALQAEQRLGLTLAEPARARLTMTYGARCVDVIERAASDAALREPLGPGTSAIGAEVTHAARHEAARRLDDILMRRLGIGAAAWPGDAIAGRAADLAARELDWDAAQRDAELARLRRMYP
jgi:glycerol-3-phosphate dehydrogenase